MSDRRIKSDGFDDRAGLFLIEGDEDGVYELADDLSKPGACVVENFVAHCDRHNRECWVVVYRHADGRQSVEHFNGAMGNG